MGGVEAEGGGGVRGWLGAGTGHTKGRGRGKAGEGVCVVVESDECPHLYKHSWLLRDRAP